MAHRKPNLPEKPCLACGRPFAWRRKWARDWAEVRYCSDACRRDSKRKRGGSREDAHPPLAHPGASD